jgi:hypothetical protein
MSICGAMFLHTIERQNFINPPARIYEVLMYRNFYNLLELESFLRPSACMSRMQYFNVVATISENDPARLQESSSGFRIAMGNPSVPV